MRAIIMLIFFTGIALGQSLPYTHYYTNANGWPEAEIFSVSPNDSNVIIIETFTYMEAQTPFYKLKRTKPALDSKAALAFVAECQANDRAIAAAAAKEARDRAIAQRVANEQFIPVYQPEDPVQAVKDHYGKEQQERSRQAVNDAASAVLDSDISQIKRDLRSIKRGY